MALIILTLLELAFIATVIVGVAMLSTPAAFIVGGAVGTLWVEAVSRNMRKAK